MKKITKDELNTGGLLKEEVIRCYPELEISDNAESWDIRSMFQWLKTHTDIDYLDAWMDGGFDYMAVNFSDGEISEVFGFFEDSEQTVNLIPIYTFCPACKHPNYSEDSETGLRTCAACSALFGNLDPKARIPYDTKEMADDSDTIYFDITVPLFNSLPDRVHGWMDRESKRVTQWG